MTDVIDRLLKIMPDFVENETGFEYGFCEGYMHYYDLRYRDQFAPKPLTCGNLLKFLQGNLADPIVPATCKDAKRWNTGFITGWLAGLGENNHELVYTYTTAPDEVLIPRMHNSAEAYEDYIRPANYPDSTKEHGPIEHPDVIDRLALDILDFESKEPVAHDLTHGILSGYLDYYHRSYPADVMQSAGRLYVFIAGILDDHDYTPAFLFGVAIGWCLGLGEHAEEKLRRLEEYKQERMGVEA